MNYEIIIEINGKWSERDEGNMKKLIIVFKKFCEIKKGKLRKLYINKDKIGMMIEGEVKRIKEDYGEDGII